MSEHLKIHHESQEANEHHEQHRAHEIRPKPEAAAELSAAEQAQKIEAIHKTIKHEAKAAHEIKVGQHEKEAPNQIGVNRELKQNAYDRIMARTQKHLSLPGRTFSKVIHQPTVDAVSRGAEKTVARPLPILSAGLFAFIGSSIVLYMAKHYGFRYNLGTFLALLLIGFAAGLLVDLVKIAIARRRPTV